MGRRSLVNLGFSPNFESVDLSSMPIAGFEQVDALIDTGASDNCIDDVLANKLKLSPHDRREISGSSGTHSATMYLAQIHIPSLGHTIFGSFAGLHLSAGGQPHGVLLGRTFLRRHRMTYDGHSGSVILQPSP